MESTLTIAIGIGVAVGVGIAMRRQGRQNRDLAERIEPLLREKGAQTLPEIGGTLGMGSFFARGKVAMALNDLAMAGKVEVIAAPEGTPQLEKVNHIRYRWR
jgi:hypothetical protein